MWALQDFVIRTYNEIKNEVPFYARPRYNSGTNEQTLEHTFRPEISKFLSSDEWLSMLIKVRLFELDRFSEVVYNEINESVLLSKEKYGIDYAIDKIGHHCSIILGEILDRR